MFAITDGPSRLFDCVFGQPVSRNHSRFAFQNHVSEKEKEEKAKMFQSQSMVLIVVGWFLLSWHDGSGMVLTVVAW